MRPGALSNPEQEAEPVVCYIIRTSMYPALEQQGEFQVLSKEELDRGSTLRGNRRIQYLLSRRILRHALGKVLNNTPDHTVKLSDLPNGPPFAPKATAMGYSFSVSHSYDMVCVAIGLLPTLGVDLENISKDRNFIKGADLFCSKRELKNFDNASQNLIRENYYRYWTQKEACLKSLGVGIGDVSMKKIEFVEAKTLTSNPSEKYTTNFPEFYAVSGCHNNYQISLVSSEPIAIQIINVMFATTLSLQPVTDKKFRNYLSRSII